jgi:hypothetical protein
MKMTSDYMYGYTWDFSHHLKISYRNRQNMMWLRMASAISGNGRKQWTIQNKKFLTFREQSPSMLTIPLLSSRFSPSCSTTMSRQCKPPDPAALPLDSPLEYDNAFVIETSSNNSALAVSLFALERSRSFLLEYLTLTLSSSS